MPQTRYLFLVLHALILCTMFSACDTPNANNQHISAASDGAFAADDHVLIVADVHLDPFDRKEFVDELAAAPIEQWENIFSRGANAGRPSSYGHDANGALFLSSLHAMREAMPHPSYVLLAGDLLAHDFHRRFMWTASKNDQAAYRSFVDKTTDFITYELTKTYPHTQIFPTIGNNDGYCGDYSSTPHDAYLAHQAAVWAPFIDPQHRFPDIASTIARGGYYRAQTASGLRILSLNSVFLAKTYDNSCGDANEHPGDEEMLWLHSILADQMVQPATVLLTHIPLGIDGFKTFFHLGFPVPLLTPVYQTALLNEIDNPDHGIATMITGHLHDVGYRQTHEGAKDNKPIVIMPSISPIFGNTPAFTVAWISKRGVIDDMAVHRLQSVSTSAATWENVVDFNQRYQLNGVTTSSIAFLHDKTGSDRRFRAIVERDSVGDAPALAITTLDWKALWCTNSALTPQAFLHCEGADH